MRSRHLAFGFVLALTTLPFACGGVSEISPYASGGAAAGGSSSNGGSGGGGKSGGSASAGSNSGASAGQASVDVCDLPQVSGSCAAAIAAFWHDPATGICAPFTYGGCGGNGNRFANREACQRACKNSKAPEWASCANDFECMLTTPGCCGSCGAADDRSLVAVNPAHAGEYSRKVCPDPVSCGACPEPSELTDTDKYYRAVCRENTCTVEDIRESPLTECNTNGDCTLRDGAGCCGGCDGRGFVSVNQRSQFCTGVACDDCASVAPPVLQAICSEGRCRLVQIPL